MCEFGFNKNNFDIKKMNAEIEEYGRKNNLHEEDVLKIQLVAEEFVSNILFPNFDGDVQVAVSCSDNVNKLSFSYEGNNFLNKINEQTILSLKIFKNKTKEISAKEEKNKTIVKFVV